MDNVKFDEATQKELTTFLEREQAQARINSTVHNLTSMCWDKCVTGTPGSRFARGEESCLLNCVDRFMDTSLFIIKTIEGQRSQQS
ncbi:Tim10/DDP family zinc finger-domain-containing protein [Suillus placidus]|jgi:import inner membrane translocase subunit TIM8|uniref:Mitochondrial import inner membrane translocase subunit n=1 Tax=Suillus placidus TaxID=48579 RepID=A0A9P7D8U2_9AGAM|nr:Tim10/DDP family zinc finger-domain-containing protein [Suillus placidus]KAG2149796.1 Tim10/DDP family zinc finger-domain-containing protein [Suillus cothurnatus]